MNSDERICSIALTLCPGIGHIGAKRLIEGMGSAAEVFSRRKEKVKKQQGKKRKKIIEKIKEEKTN